MNLKACGYYVLIEIKQKDEIESSSIYIPKDIKDSQITNSDTGVVLDIGPICFSGMEALMGIKGSIERAKVWGFEIGDTVEFTRYDGKRPSTEGYENCRLIQDAHIITKVEE